MPQTLSKQWKEELGSNHEDIHSVWVNRIANLTITGYNSEYSNRPFATKKTMDGGFAESPYLLNAYVKEQEEWGLQQLEERSELLAKRALELWPYPTSSFEPEKEVIPFEPMGFDRSFTGRYIVAVELEGTKSSVTTWGSMLVKTLRMLLEYDRDAVLAMAEDTRQLATSNVKQLVEKDRRWIQVDPALAVFKDNSTSAKLGLLRKICSSIGYDPDEVLIYVRPERVDGDATNSTQENAENIPYAELVALKPLIDELVGSNLDEADTADERKELVSAVETYRVEEPKQVLGGVTLQEFINQHDVQDMTAEQAIACLSLFAEMADLMGQQVWHDAILRGTVSMLLSAMEEAAK